MTLDEIDALLSHTSNGLGLEPPPNTPDTMATAQPVAMREQGNNRRNKQHADQYMGDIGAYLQKVRSGRSVRAVDPNQPAFSPRAEMIRQAQTVTKANRFERGMK